MRLAGTVPTFGALSELFVCPSCNEVETKESTDADQSAVSGAYT